MKPKLPMLMANIGALSFGLSCTTRKMVPSPPREMVRSTFVGSIEDRGGQFSELALSSATTASILCCFRKSRMLCAT